MNSKKEKGKEGNLHLTIFGELNKHNPYVGYFIHSPILPSSNPLLHSSSSSSSHPPNFHDPTHISPPFLSDQYENIATIDEINRRKHSQQHPFTGCFHYAPGKYSRFYQLEKYRKNPSHGTKIKSIIKSPTNIDQFLSNQITASVDDSLIDFHHKKNLKYYITNQKASHFASKEPKLSMRLNEWGNTNLPLPRRKRSETSPADYSLSHPLDSVWEIQSHGGVHSFPYPKTSDSSRLMTEKYLLFPNMSLGEGSYAKIYLGKHIASSHYLAIKVIPLPTLITNSNTTSLPELPELIANEIQNQSRVWHPHVVNIYHVFQSTAYLYIVMDYCSGGNLEQMLSLRNRLDENEARIIIFQLLDGLNCLHRKGILHGDIKPANVMFQPQSNIFRGKSSSSHHHEKTKIPSNPIDLLYEKKRKEGKLTLSIQQIPIIEDLEEDRSTNCSEIIEDMKNAILVERFLQEHELHETKSTHHTTSIIPKRRRAMSECPMVSPPLEYNTGDNTSTMYPIVETDSNTQQDYYIEQEFLSHKHLRYKSPYGLLLKLCDFGLSQTIPNVKFFHLTGSIYRAPYTNPCGTQGYLAPEIIEQKSYGLPADIWAVGVILYKIISGNFPFIPFDLYTRRDVSFNGVVWKKISIECKELIKLMLTVNELDRVTASQAINHSWFHEILLISKIIVPSDDIQTSLAHTKEAARR